MRHVPTRTHRPPGMTAPGRGLAWPAALTSVVAIAGLVALAEPAMAVSAAAPNKFRQTNLIANTASLHPRLVDRNLTNAWGLAAGPNTPLWVSDNNSGFASVYSGGIGGGSVSLALTVPVPGGNPTGQAFNPTRAFPVGGRKGSPAIFIVDSDSVGAKQSPGQIEAWNGGAKFVVEDKPSGGAGGKTPKGAVFKGLALAASTKAGPELFAADVANARVDVFNRNFGLVATPKEFRDAKLPKGYAPFGIQQLGGKIYVAYGKQNAQKTDVVFGAGLGVVDVYDVNGKLLHHLIGNGRTSVLNAPWGLAIAPKKFGPFGGDLLVGNLGNGKINAFSPKTGKFIGVLRNAKGQPIVIDGLWGLRVGNSQFGGSSSLEFSAGPAGYGNGVVGVLNPVG